jgi:hypothetical protein
MSNVEKLFIVKFLNPIVNSIIPSTFMLLAFFSAESTKRFRISLDYHWVYSCGAMGCYILHLIALILAVINTIYIIREWEKLDKYLKWIALISTLIPIYFWAYIFILIS